jgi:DNA-binding response OmpR family regulator
MVDRAEATEARGRILLAEDEPHIRRILTTMFEYAGFAVVSFEDGSSAIEALRGDEAADLIVTDLVMPGASGLELLRKVRDLPHRTDTPVIVLTAKGQDVDRETALALGADEFMTKPFSPKKLLARVDEILSG